MVHASERRRRQGWLCQLHVLADHVVPVPDLENATVHLVVADTILGWGSPVALAALKGAVNDVSGHTISGEHACVALLGGRRPAVGHHGVARRLGRLRCHPPPDSRLERDDRVGGHQVRVTQQVQPQRVPSLPVVVVAVICKLLVLFSSSVCKNKSF